MLNTTYINLNEDLTNKFLVLIIQITKFDQFAENKTILDAKRLLGINEKLTGSIVNNLVLDAQQVFDRIIAKEIVAITPSDEKLLYLILEWLVLLTQASLRKENYRITIECYDKYYHYIKSTETQCFILNAILKLCEEANSKDLKTMYTERLHQLEVNFILKITKNNESPNLQSIRETSAIRLYDLKKLRETYAKKLTALKTSSEIILLQKEFTNAYGEIINEIIDESLEAVGGSPFKRFAIVSLGSLSQQCSQPFSDFEFIILAEPTATQELDIAFIENFIKLISLKMIMLRETQTNAIPFVFPSGLHLDTGSLIDRYTLPQWGFFLKNEIHSCHAGHYNQLLGSVINGNLLHGSGSLFAELQTIIRHFLATHCKLVGISQIKFNSDGDATNLKKYFYIPIVSLIQGLCTYNQIIPKSPYDGVKQLQTFGIFSTDFATKLINYLGQVSLLRAHMHFMFNEENENFPDKCFNEFKNFLPANIQTIWNDTVDFRDNELKILLQFIINNIKENELPLLQNITVHNGQVNNTPDSIANRLFKWVMNNSQLNPAPADNQNPKSYP